MTSLRKIHSNRRNALKSTGPRTEQGKQRSSQNARRHGLTAETVIEPLEDLSDYRVFEQSVMADYDAISAVERALVVRVAGLFWRLRRATFIETGLLQLAHECAHSKTPSPPSIHDKVIQINQDDRVDDDMLPNSSIYLARCFRRLLTCEGSAFELLCRYEGTLWRQLRQTLYSLERIKRQPIASRKRPRFFWHDEPPRPFRYEEPL